MKNKIENDKSGLHEASFNHELLERKPTVLCLCHGNVMRSQWAELLFKLMGIDAVSAALGDVSRQQYQGEVPQHIVELMKVLSLYGALNGNKIKEVDEKTFNLVDTILVFCDPKYLNDFSFIDQHDPRIHLMESPDPFGSIGQYEEVLLEIINAVVSFVRENMRDNLPSAFSTEVKFTSIYQFIFGLDLEIQNSFKTPTNIEEYFHENGQNNSGVIHKILKWVLLRKQNENSERYMLMPNDKQSLQIIEAIEQGRYAEAISIINDLKNIIDKKILYVENELLFQKNDEKKLLDDRIMMLRSLVADYLSFIRVLQRNFS